MKMKYKVLGAIAIVGLFAVLAIAPALTTTTTTGSNEIYNPAVDDYLLNIEYDADNCIVSTDGVSVQKQYEWSGDDSATTTTKYEKKTASNNGASVLENLGSQTTKVYPGAILKADTALANGTPNPISLDRANTTLSITLSDARSKIVNPGSYNNVKLAIGSMIEEWAVKSGSASVSFSENFKTGYSCKQLSVELGIDLNFLDGIGIDGNWEETNESQTCVFDYTRTFYTVSADTNLHPGAYFNKNVTLDDVKLAMKDEPAVFVQSATYGMMILFSATTTSTTTDIGVALSLAISGHYGELSVEEQEAIKNTSITMTVIGGTQSTSGKTIKYDLSEGDSSEFFKVLNEYLASKDVGADDYKNAALLSAETVFLDSGEVAHSYVSTEYVEKTTVLTTKIDVTFHMHGAYCGSCKVQYSTYDSIDENGNYVNVQQKEISWSWVTYEYNSTTTITAKHTGPFKVWAKAEWGNTALDWYEISVPQESIYVDIGGTTFNVSYALYVDGAVVASS